MWQPALPSLAVLEPGISHTMVFGLVCHTMVIGLVCHTMVFGLVCHTMVFGLVCLTMVFGLFHHKCSQFYGECSHPVNHWLYPLFTY